MGRVLRNTCWAKTINALIGSSRRTLKLRIGAIGRFVDQIKHNMLARLNRDHRLNIFGSLLLFCAVRKRMPSNFKGELQIFL